MTAIPDPTSQRDDAPRWVSLVWSDYFQALVARCPSPCDDDCEQVNDGIVCHEGHQPRHKQMHDVEACVERQRGWRTYSTATTFIPIGAVVTRPVVPLAEKDEAMDPERWAEVAWFPKVAQTAGRASYRVVEEDDGYRVFSDAADGAFS